VQAVTLVNSRRTYAALDNADLVPDPLGTALLVPGFTGSKEDFIAVLKPLASRKVRALAIDLSGQYESLVPEDSGLSLAAFAGDVGAVAELVPRPLILVGHSFGGLVTREAVLGNPLAVDGLVLIASGPASLPPAQQDVLQRFSQVMATHGPEAVWQAKRALDAAAGVPEPPPDIDEFLSRRFLANAPTSMQAMIDTLCSAEDRTEALAALAPPTSVVIGGRDDVWPLDEQLDMAHRLNATVVELPEAGHSPAVDAPDAVADVIASHLPRNV
jgi:pimeloyl-ACP methyl ester carboxylesterase